MKQDILGKFDLPWLPMTAMIIFVICFSAYAYWTYKKENKAFYEQLSLLPLQGKSDEK